MRYVIKNEQSDETLTLYTKDLKHQEELTLEKKILRNKKDFTRVEKIYVKKMATSTFYSVDQKSWIKLTPIVHGAQKKSALTIAQEHYELHQGHLPISAKNEPLGNLITQIPGKVVKILVVQGQKVEVGASLMILEAMKMENEIKSQVSGVVEKILVKEGQALEAKSLLMTITTFDSNTPA